ncbi:MAG: hypothetical protein K9G44_05755 [Melioribacteraceae bacterium]|nr:hypothetical protein [Melioribacteraceae bacterium]
MKLKPIYIYLGGFVLIIALISVFSYEGNSIQTADNHIHDNSGMPDDEVHSNLNTPPGASNATGSNVMAEIKVKLKELKEIADANPNDFEAQKNYADFLTSAHQSTTAIDYYMRALELEPESVYVLTQLTYIYYNAGSFDKAENVNNKILLFAPENQEANYNVAAIAKAKGEDAKAISVWKSLVQKFPGTEVAKFSQEALNKLNAN